MDSLKFLLYTLGRIGVLIAVLLFSTLMGIIVFPAISSFLPEKSGLSQFLLNRTAMSAVAWFIVSAFMLVLFFDDGKKHAAYEIWNSINIIIVLILMLLIYYIPSVFHDDIFENAKAKAVYNVFYFPVLWLEKGVGVKPALASSIGIGVILLLMFGVYVISYKAYNKKHKELWLINKA